MKTKESRNYKRLGIRYALERDTRPYSAEDVIRLRGSIDIEHTLRAAVLKSFGHRFIRKITLTHLAH